MSSPRMVIQILRAELRAARVTYKLLAERIRMSESSIKRMFTSSDMSLSRIEVICKAVGISMGDVLKQAADSAPAADMLTAAQEHALVTDPKLLLVATCCLGRWSLEQILEAYVLTRPEVVRCLARLDKLGFIELKPLDRYRVKVSNTFRWRADGPVQQFFRKKVIDDYFSGRFDGPGETLLCVPASLSLRSAQEVVMKIQRLAGELAQLHQDDQQLALDHRDGYTLLLGFRSWELAAFTAMRRVAGGGPSRQASKSPRSPAANT